MKDLTIYDDEELSNQVFNDEYFWNEKDNLPYLFDLINEEFITTKEQRDKMIGDLIDYNNSIKGV